MRTTIRLSESTLRQAKKYALEHHTTLNSLMEESLCERLYRTEKTGSASTVVLPTFKGNGLRPGVNLHDSADLLDRMEHA